MKSKLTGGWALLLGALICCTSCQRKTEVVTNKTDTIVLTVLAGQSTSDAGIEDIIDDWLKKAHPDVKLDWECVDWGERFDAQLRTRFAAGDAPDIIVGKAQDVKAYVSTGNLAPMPKPCADRIKPEALEAVTVNGTVYGLPFNAWYQGVIYYKDIFEAYGLKVPETMSQLSHVVEVIHGKGQIPFASHFGENWYLGNTTMQFMMNEVFCKTPAWGEAFRAGEVNYSDSSPVRLCMENNKYILDHTWPDALTIDQYESDNRFANQKAVMYLTGSWSLQFTNQYGSSDRFGIFPYPNKQGDAKLLRETNLTFMKSSKTLHSELINKLFEEILSDDQLLGEILEYTQTQSVVKGFEPSFRSCIQDDIDEYERRGKIIDVTAGNNQLVWSFQNSVAGEELLWLRGEKKLDDVLWYADQRRRESMNE